MIDNDIFAMKQQIESLELSRRSWMDEAKALEAKAAQVTAFTAPEGWKLVPEELTEAMAEAWKQAPAGGFPDSYPSQYFGPSYRAMIAAAPNPPVQSEQSK